MNTVVIKNKDQLKSALKSDATEIIVDDDQLVAQLRNIKRLRVVGPFAVAGAVAAITLVPFTGGASAVAGGAALSAAAGSSISTLGIAGLCIAIGGTVVIGIFTDWEEVELVGVFKLKRKGSKP